MPTVITSGAASAKGYGYAAKAAADPVYVEDVFSTYLYTGTGASQTITNGVDLSTKGGLVWIKSRSAADSNFLFDTLRGSTKKINSDTTTGEGTLSDSLTAFNGDGFTISSASGVGVNSDNYVGWTFRKQAKFFTICTWTGNGSNREISHDLGSAPGAIFVKRTDTTGNWRVYHRSLTSAAYAMQLNQLNAEASAATVWNSTTPTSTAFSVGTDATVNANNGTYVAYLFAHDAGGFGLSGTDSVISCGTFTTDASGRSSAITLGWEPAFIITKSINISAAWYIYDNMRGVFYNANPNYLRANNSGAESSHDQIFINSTGFKMGDASLASGGEGNATYIYIAIRRGPMQVPTDATKVFQPKVYTGTDVDNRLVTTDIVTDMVMVRQRNDTVLGGVAVGDRLRGQPYLLTGSTAAEVDDVDSFDKEIVSTTEYGTAFSSMTGFWVGNDATAKLNANTTSNNHVALAFKRTAGFFDAVCYSGDSTARSITHSLGAIPQLWIIKNRGGAYDWAVGSTLLSNPNKKYLFLNSTAAEPASDASGNVFETPTSTTIGIGAEFPTDYAWNRSGQNYVAYLFATCAGVSKVGSYTGTGTTKQIDCGFTGGARFVMIKRTDSTGDWYVWDTARGVVSGNDPYLLLNSTAAEVTNTDYIDPYSAGFEISSTAPAAINANGGTFLFLAIA